MTHRATRDVVRRVMPLLEQLATTTIDRARLLQYLSAMASVDWQVMDIVSGSDEAGEPAEPFRQFTLRDRTSGDEHTVVYPAVLDPAIEPLAREEYKRLALGDPLTMMSQPFFAHLYQQNFCQWCRWQGTEYEAFHRECRFAGRPVNFELE